VDRVELAPSSSICSRSSFESGSPSVVVVTCVMLALASQLDLDAEPVGRV
jgi:hypothetical protein